MTWTTTCRKKQRDVNVFHLTALGIGSSFAVGGFVVLGDLIKNVTGPAVLLSIALAGATALFGGICFAELGVQFLKADSAYAFSYSFGKKHTAFVFGWALILQYAAGAASVGKGVLSFIDALAENKLSHFMKDLAATNFKNVFVYFDFLSLAIIVIVIIVLLFGVKNCATVINICTICNVVLVVSILIAGSFKADMKNWHTNGSESEKSKGGFLPFGILGVTEGAAVAFYAFIGFDLIGVSGSEVKSRKKSVPIAVMTTIVWVFFAYAGVGAVLTLILPYDKLNQYAALPFAFEQLGSTAAKWVVTVTSFSAFLTSLFGVSLPLPRIIQAMARDGLLFRFLDNNPLKMNISKMAILFGGLLSGAATGIFSFRILVSLTVLGALCVYTIVAVHIILARYSQKSENDNWSEPWLTCTNGGPGISIKTVIRNCFSLKGTTTANLTEKIVVANIILYCLSSVGLGVMYSVFSDSLFKGYVETVVPCSVFLCIILLSLFSLIRQQKLETVLPFEVPFVPLLPCLSIFLNIFLMTTFDSVTWIIFSGWMALGILFHLIYQCLNSFDGDLAKDSLYEINKSNALKLNEAIWKIKFEKKSFYEGAVNPVFIDESETPIEEVKTTPENAIKVHNEKAIMQLKQAEIIQTAEMVMEEKTEPLEDETESRFVGVKGNSPEENTSVHWECVAEIHTEEEFPQESIVLEIVDNTYNFLSEVSEESPKDNVSQKSINKPRRSIESMKESDERKNSDILEEFGQPTVNDITEDMKQNSDKNLRFQDELLNKIKDRQKTAKENFEEKEDVTKTISHQPQDLGMCQTEDDFVNFVIETLYEAPKSDMITRTHKIIYDTNGEKETKMPEEHNRIKEFKEKLNQLLKNQINFGGNPEKSFTVLKSENEEEMSKKKSEAALFESIKTLNKTQIRGKLEVLLAKGPPKRPSFRNQFRNNIKEGEIEKNKTDHEINASKESVIQKSVRITEDEH